MKQSLLMLCAFSLITLFIGQLTAFAQRISDTLWVREPVEKNVPWQPIGHAQRVVGLAGLNGNLYAVTSNNDLFVRTPVFFDVSWTKIGRAEDISGMTSLNGQLFVTTKSTKKLWVASPAVNGITPWVSIGPAEDVVAMTALNGRLYVATSNNKLWVRDPVNNPGLGWTHIGPAESVVGMTALNGKLYAATNNNRLWVREPKVDLTLGWTLIGHADNITAMTTLNGKLFAANFKQEAVPIPTSDKETGWLTCKLWQTNHFYWQARALIRTGKNSGKIKSKAHCLSLANDAGQLGAVLGGSDLIGLMAGDCANCACQDEF